MKYECRDMFGGETIATAKPMIPKDVADEMSFAKSIKGVTFDDYIVRELIRSDYKDSATNKMIQSLDVPNAIEVLLNAWNNGYTVEKEKKCNVKVPHADKTLYRKHDSGALFASICVGQQNHADDFLFTAAEIEHYGLQDCEKEEVTDDGQ